VNSAYRQHHKTVREPSPWALSSILGALVIALILSLAHYLGPNAEVQDNSAEWGESQSMKELQNSEAGSEKRQAAAQQVCNETRGPNSEARWLPDGSLVCTVRRGVVKAQVQL